VVVRKELRTINRLGCGQASSGGSKRREVDSESISQKLRRGGIQMRTEKYANIVLTTITAALIFPCWDQYQEKMVVRAATQQKATIAGTESPIPMISEQNSQTAAPTTRMVIDRFNEAFNRHDADALGPLLTDDTVFEDTSPAPDGQRIEGKAAVLDNVRYFSHI
jgi:hypothetical protein